VKRLPILVKMVLLLVCFSFMLSAYNSGSTVNRNIVIPYVQLAPELDGEMDADWTFPPNGNFVFEKIDSDSVPATTDHSAFWKAAYNENGFYFWARVTDDSIYVDTAANTYEQDCFELYFDGDDSDSTTYDGVDDVQWRWRYGVDVGAGEPGGGQPECPNAEAAWAELPDGSGYTFELIIPTSDLVFTPEPGTEIGFEVQTADNDGEGRETITKWWNIDGQSWLNPQLFGNAMLGGNGALEEEVVGDFIEEVDLAPVLDGENTNGEWDVAPEVKMTVNESWAIADDEGYKDFQPYYKAAWNADGFYFFAHVIDDSIYVDTAANSWEQDCFELYFDGDNSDSTSYDGVDDVQWRWRYGVDVGAGEAGGGQPGCPNAEAAWVKTGDGYNFELIIPSSDLVFTPEVGAVIGFEVQAADNDTGTRDVISKWWNIDGQSWLNPSLFGTVELVATGASTAPGWPEVAGVKEEAEAANAGISLAVPSVITTNAAVVKVSVPAGTAAKVSLFNIAGQLVKSAATNGDPVTLDVSDLANGVYLCNLKAGGESVTEKITLIK